jgi:hypothetical protein
MLDSATVLPFYVRFAERLRRLRHARLAVRLLLVASSSIPAALFILGEPAQNARTGRSAGSHCKARNIPDAKSSDTLKAGHIYVLRDMSNL